MTAENYRQAEHWLVIKARSHKIQLRLHRMRAKETMERLKMLREQMARLGIPVEIVNG